MGTFVVVGYDDKTTSKILRGGHRRDRIRFPKIHSLICNALQLNVAFDVKCSRLVNIMKCENM